MERTVNIIGLGYIGLPTAALLARHGWQVHGVDINEQVVEQINNGQAPIFEPDLQEHLDTALEKGHFKAFTQPATATVHVICVPTPLVENDSGEAPTPDLQYVMAAAESLVPVIKAGDLVLLESTSPVGTTAGVAKQLDTMGVDTTTVDFAYCPERVLPGNTFVELVENARVVGGLTATAATRAEAFYRSFVTGPIQLTNAATAEMCKLAENSFRDVNIAFANELSMLCAEQDVDVQELTTLCNFHPRVNILNAGVGVGGHCIAVDPWFLVSKDPENSPLLQTARAVNTKKTAWVVDKITAKLAELTEAKKSQPRVACLGLTYKPNIDDLRESPALNITKQLQLKGQQVAAVDPYVQPDAKAIKGLELWSLDEALQHADLLVLLVAHQQFTEHFSAQSPEQPLLDFCGALPADNCAKHQTA